MSFNRAALVLLATLLCGCVDLSVAEESDPTNGGGNEGGGTSDPDLSIPDNYTLSWSDEFDSGLTPDTTNWTYDLGSQLIGGTVWGNNEQQHYTSSAANSYLQDGKLIIQAIHETPEDGGEGGDVAEGVIATSARLKTDTDAFYEAIGSEPYGFYEVRAALAPALDNLIHYNQRVVHNLRPNAKNGYFCSQLGSKAEFIQ